VVYRRLHKSRYYLGTCETDSHLPKEVIYLPYLWQKGNRAPLTYTCACVRETILPSRLPQSLLTVLVKHQNTPPPPPDLGLLTFPTANHPPHNLYYSHAHALVPFLGSILYLRASTLLSWSLTSRALALSSLIPLLSALDSCRCLWMFLHYLPPPPWTLP